MTQIEKQFWLRTVPGEIALIGGGAWFFVVFDKVIPFSIFCGIMAIRYLSKEYIFIIRELSATAFCNDLIYSFKAACNIPQSKIDQIIDKMVGENSDEVN